ncbi:MAG TPA: efflux transporter outer membrane subunit [Casimicrobiaceae bacterium]|nr:efflux transporter outer membrane subunit [Casimicrobiaceae bacterium]
MRIRSTVALAIAAFVATGCASMQGLAPESKLQSADRLSAQQSLAGGHLSPAAWPAQDWWKSYGDPQLDALVTEALADSPTLRIAEARTRKAVAFAQGAEATLYPRVDASASSEAQRLPEHGTTPPPFAGTNATLNQLQLTLGWELDFWGKNRSAYEAALGQAKASEVDAYATRLALSTSIAQAYVQLERAYLQLDIAQHTLEERERIYALTRDRNAAGIDSRTELKQAESALPATREQIAQLNEAIGLARNQIAALMGQGPDRGLAIARPTAALLEPPALPSVLPAQLIGRRPDLTAQRWRIEAAQKDVASAKAQFYPDVNLLAFVGLQTFGGGNLLSAASRMAGVGPAVTLPIFDAGRLRANLAGRDADYDIVVEQYNQGLADAMRDVVDQVTSLRSVDEQRTQERQALATAQEAYDLALMRYREGIGNYLQVLSAEQPLLVQEGLEADLKARELALSINLVRALGGGFEPTPVVAAAGK